MEPRNKAILSAFGVVGSVVAIIAVMSVITLFIGEWVAPVLFAVCLVYLGISTYKSAKKDFENDKTEEQ